MSSKRETILQLSGVLFSVVVVLVPTIFDIPNISNHNNSPNQNHKSTETGGLLLHLLDSSCRAVDTRLLSPPFGGVDPGESLTFSLTEICDDIPITAKAVEVNIVSVYSYSNGYIKAWPYDDSEEPFVPVANFFSLTPPNPSNIAQNNRATILLPQDGSGNVEFKVFTSETGFIVDVFGYYELSPARVNPG